MRLYLNWIITKLNFINRIKGSLVKAIISWAPSVLLMDAGPVEYEKLSVIPDNRLVCDVKRLNSTAKVMI